MIPGRTLTRKHIAGRDSRQAFRDRKRSYLLIHSSYDRRLGDYERLWSRFSRNRKKRAQHLLAYQAGSIRRIDQVGERQRQGLSAIARCRGSTAAR